MTRDRRIRERRQERALEQEHMSSLLRGTDDRDDRHNVSRGRTSFKAIVLNVLELPSGLLHRSNSSDSDGTAVIRRNDTAIDDSGSQY